MIESNMLSANLPEPQIVMALGSVPIRRTKVRDRSNSHVKFISALVPSFTGPRSNGGPTVGNR